MTNNVLCDEFAERFADLLERDVDEATRATLEAHALSCADCGSLLADIRKLRIDASSLPVLEPARDLWSGILERIDAPVIPLRSANVERSVTVRQWRRWAPMAAAAVLLVVLTSTSTYYLTIRGHIDSTSTRGVASAPPTRLDTAAQQRGEPATVASRGVDSMASVARAARPASAKDVPGSLVRPVSAEQLYTSEIARLRVVLERRRAQLDPVTISVVERNLQVIDDAIAQCKIALAKDPASRFLMESLNNALENKVELLRTATMLPARS